MNTDQRPAPIYRLTLRPEAGAVPQFMRLRRCLKALLRQYGLRCLEIEEVPDPACAVRPAYPDSAGRSR